MNLSDKQAKLPEVTKTTSIPKLGFEYIERTPTASLITKCGDLQKESAKVG